LLFFYTSAEINVDVSNLQLLRSIYFQKGNQGYLTLHALRT